MVFETQHWITRSRDQGITSQFIFDRLPGQRAWTIFAKFFNTLLSYAPKENEHLSCIPFVVIFRIPGISECNAASTTLRTILQLVLHSLVPMVESHSTIK